MAAAIGTLLLLVAAGCSPTYAPPAQAGASPGTTLPVAPTMPTGRSSRPSETEALPRGIPYEYIVTDAAIVVYRVGRWAQPTRQIGLPQLAAGVRGVSASPATGLLYISYGGDGGPHGNGGLLAYDPTNSRLAWTRTYSFGIDSMDISPDGRRIYMPTGELSRGGVWKVLDASTGAVVGAIHGGAGPHNTLVSPDGRAVYLGGRDSNDLFVASTATDQVIRRIGPLVGGVRPFTVTGRQTFAFTTATRFLGFQVSDIKSGRVLYSVRFPGTFAQQPSAPSHGISLSPDEKDLYVIDHPHDAVRVYDVRDLPRRPPSLVTVIHLRGTFDGSEAPCAYDCTRDGWLQHTRDGRFVFVGDAGDVIDTTTRSTVAVLPALRNTRKFLEIYWANGRMTFATPREGRGFVEA